MKNYITQSGEHEIRNFKYKGGSLSYSYKYVWSPIAEFFLKFTPTTIAPNVITLLGMIILLLGWFPLAYQSPISTPLQPITILIFSFSFFVYQTLDNMDGKQARRTGSSSPLGMIFDHGCDAFLSIFFSFAIGRIGFIQEQVAIILGSFFALQLGFFLAAWMQYHSNGLMILGEVNGPDDGIPLAWGLGIFTYIIGQDWWMEQGFFGYKNYYGLVFFAVLASIIQVISLILNAKHEFTTNTFEALKEFTNVVLRIGSFLIMVYYTNWYLESKYFYQIYFSLSLPFVRDITYIQICVVTKQKYQQFQNPAIVYIIAYPSYILMRQCFGITLLEEGLFVNLLTLYFVLQYAHFVTAIAYQISNVLNIKIFSLQHLTRKGSKIIANPEKQNGEKNQTASSISSQKKKN